MDLQRPFGVTLLSSLAFLASVGLVVLCAKGMFAFFDGGGLPLAEFQIEPVRFVVALAVLIVFFSCFLVLAAIAFVAGRDLWHLRARGRRLATTSAILLLSFGGVLLFVMLTEQGGLQEKIIAGIVCGVSLISLLYLFLPTVKKRFESSTAPTS